MRNEKSRAHSAILGALMLGFSSAAVASPALATDRMAQAGQQAASYSDEQLRSYAQAAIQVQQINMAMEQATQNTSDPDELQSVQQQAYADLERVIQENGLTVDEYNAIGSLAQTDEETRNKVTAYFQEAQEQQGGQPAPPPAQ